MTRWLKPALAVLALAVLGALWRTVLEPWREDRHWVYAARTVLRSLSELEQAYCFYTGRYTEDLLKLSSMSPEPGKVAETLEVFMPGSLRIQATAEDVRLSARARDRKGTALAFEARKPKK